MARQELDGGNTRKLERDSGVQAHEVDAATAATEIDGGGSGQAHEMGGEHWRREM